MRQAGERFDLTVDDFGAITGTRHDGKPIRITEPTFTAVEMAIDALHSCDEVLWVIPQNVYKFWAVATRRPRMGSGWPSPSPSSR